MPEHIRALVVVLVFSTGVFLAARGAVVQLVPDATFKRWRNLWVVSTLALFLTHNIWLCFLLLAVLMLVARRKEAHVMGLYFVVLFAGSAIPATIPGFGLINYFWTLDHYRLLALTLLLPTALSLARRSGTLRLGRSPVDRMVLGYLCLLSALSFRDTSATDGMRSILSLWVDIFLPYYVASRSIRDMDGLRYALVGYVLGAMLLVPVAAFEAVHGWRLYPAAVNALGLNGNLFGMYLARSGFLRPAGSVVNSIVLGYTLVVALGFFLYLKEFLRKPFHRWLGLSVLVIGILASLSRGPWVGAAFLVLVFVLLGPLRVSRMARLLLFGSTALLILAQLPFGQLFIDMLPVIGTVEQGNVEYRADLLTNALPVIERHLWFGSAHFLEAPELQVMMQGEGIIDIVNSYVGVALHSGVIGLALFAGAFVTALFQLRRGIRLARPAGQDAAVLGRALWATLAAIMLIIYTVSSIFVIPTVYWAVVGLCVAYATAMKDANSQSRERAP
jgi:hypothetical protein